VPGLAAAVSETGTAAASKNKKMEEKKNIGFRLVREVVEKRIRVRCARDAFEQLKGDERRQLLGEFLEEEELAELRCAVPNITSVGWSEPIFVSQKTAAASKPPKTKKKK
jgi:hypothetical protein